MIEMEPASRDTPVGDTRPACEKRAAAGSHTGGDIASLSAARYRRQLARRRLHAKRIKSGADSIECGGQSRLRFGFRFGFG